MKKQKKRLNHGIIKRTIENKFFVSILVILFLFMVFSYLFKGFIYELINNDLSSITYFVNSFNGLSAVIFVVLNIFEVIIAPVPGLILNVAGGWIFGPFWGSILVLIGNIIGASVCYYLARYIGSDYFEIIIGKKKLKKFNRYLNEYGPFVIFILRLNPLTSTDIFSYLAGLVNMKYKSFIISTTLGLLPLVFALSYFGDYFIDGSVLFRLVFFIVTIFYLSLFLYGLYKIGKNKLKRALRK